MLSQVVSLNGASSNLSFKALPVLRRTSGVVKLRSNSSSGASDAALSHARQRTSSSASTTSVDLSHIKKSDPAPFIPPPQKKVMAWDGGKIVTNKAEALRKFLARKRKRGETISETEKKIIEVALRKNKKDTVFDYILTTHTGG